MNLYKKRVVLLYFIVAVNNICVGQTGDSKNNSQINELENQIPGILDSASIPGLSIAIISKGELIWNKGFGVVNKESGIAVNERTIFPAASLGKPVFAYAVLKLADIGKVHLDSPIISSIPMEYLETNFLNGKKLVDENIKLITPRMILSHSSGLPNWRKPGHPIKTIFKPGEQYLYSGEGYFLLQITVEYIMKQPIENVMKNYVFQPLNMKNSTFLPLNNADFTSAYGNDGKIINRDTLETANVAHTFKSNAAEYSRFIIAVMDGTGLSKVIFNEMLTPQITTDICQAGKVSWGLGVAIQQTDQGNTFFQWGKSPNASAYVIGFKDSKRALIYFTNIANQGLRIAEVLVRKALNYSDNLFSCFGVKQYNQ